MGNEGGGGGGGGSAAFLYGFLALVYIGLFAVRPQNYPFVNICLQNIDKGVYIRFYQKFLDQNTCQPELFPHKVLIWFMSQPKNLERMKNRWWGLFHIFECQCFGVNISKLLPGRWGRRGGRRWERRTTPERGRRPPTRQVHRATVFPIVFFCIFIWQAYLEEIKEITEEENKKKGGEVNSQAEETAAEKKADDSVDETEDKKTILLESQAKEIILETTFANPNPTEIQQIVKNEPKPLLEKKED